MRELEEYKKYWNGSEIDDKVLGTDNRDIARKLVKGRLRTSKHILMRHHLFSLVISLLLPLISPVLLYLGFPILVADAYAAFGIVTALISGYLYLFTKRNNFMSMPTVDALKAVMKLSRQTITLNIVCFTLAFGVCGAMLWESLDSGDIYIFYGLLTGIVIGLPIGCLRFRSKIRHLRKLRNELRSIL